MMGFVLLQGRNYHQSGTENTRMIQLFSRVNIRRCFYLDSIKVSEQFWNDFARFFL